MRQVVLDTETTGLEVTQGHRVIEIGCVEILNRRMGRSWHQYLQPDRPCDEGALEVHGITDHFLADKPRFAEVAEDFLAFIKDAELVIHNAPFDIGFLDAELARLERPVLAEFCTVRDSLELARRLHPGQKNSLDALCRRYEVDTTQRELHGALLDARLLAEAYLAMTGGQVSLSLTEDVEQVSGQGTALRRLPADRPPLRVIRAGADELEAHRARLRAIREASDGVCLWETD